MTTDRFGFQFCLKWVLSFTATFLVSVFFWTWLLQKSFGVIRGQELTITWSLSVFGTWFLLVVPFMRKKERIWKRLNQDQEKALTAWLRAMTLFISLLILSAFFWSFFYRQEILAAQDMSRQWAKAIFATWLTLLLPFLI